ncbi:MAG: ATP-binding cassette domain-containing protein [Chloroflexia bacterium]
MDYAIEAEELTRVFGALVAVDRLTLTVRRPEILGLVGPDGAGKTTTIRMLAGILPPTSGRARVLGFVLPEQAEKIKAHIGYMPQRFSLYADLTVEENLAFFAEIYQVPRPERARRMEELLQFARLSAFRKRPAGYLSGGMKQKLALACTLIHRPDLLLLDEPTTGVDPVARREFWGILYHLLSQGRTILVSTPYMDEAERCNRVAFLARGRLLQIGTPEELKAAYPHELLEVRARPLEEAAAQARGLPGVLDVQTFGETLHLVVEEARAAQETVRSALQQAGLTLLQLRPIAPTMEDVFMALLGRAGEPSRGKEGWLPGENHGTATLA